MSNGSFYGGRRGASFVIVKNYPNINSMVQDFQKGSSFSEVKFDEYVLINAVNRNHPDNGKVFRRGYDYNSSRTITAFLTFLNENDEQPIGKNGTEEDYQNAQKHQTRTDYPSGGAIYVGTIAGPAGNAPFLNMVSYDDAINYYNRAGEGSRRKMSSGSISGSDLLPGKNENGTFNDSILWYSASIVSDNLEEGEAYIGFRVPYPVIDFTVKENTPYEQIGIDRTDDKTHPFYEKWEIGLPRGKHGNAIKEIKIVKADASLNIYLAPNQPEPMTAQDFQDRGLTEIDDILVYVYQNYENSNPSEEKLCFLAEYKQVSNIQVLDDGTLVITYTDESLDDTTFPNVLSKITRLSYNDEEDSEEGLLRIEYNTGETLSIPIVYTNKIDLKDNGIMAFKNNLESDDVLENPDEDHILGELKWIKRVEYDDTEKTLRIFYNTQVENPETQEIENEKDEFELSAVSDLKIEDNGQVKIRKGNNEWENIYDDSIPPLPRVLKWITDIVYNAAEDQMQIYFNSDAEGQPSEVIPNAFNRITNVVFDESVIFDDVTPVQIGPGFIITYSSGETTKVRFSTGKLIKSMELIPGERYVIGDVIEYTNSTLRVTYTNDSIEDFQLKGKMVDSFSIEEETPIPTEDDQTITVPRSSLKVTYDNTLTETLDFLYPRSVVVDDATINNSHRIKVYDSQGNKMYQSNPINGISRVSINNNRLLVLYDNPTARNAIPAGRAVEIEQGDGTILIWDNLGIVRTDSGILVGKNIVPSDVQEPFSTDSEIIAYLNENFPDGQVVDSLYHIITVGEEGQNKKFYGFDYIDETWYFLGAIEEAAIEKECVVGTQEEFESASDYKKGLLGAGGLYFIVTED